MEKHIPRDRFYLLAQFLKTAAEDVQRVADADQLHEFGVRINGWKTLVSSVEKVQGEIAKIAGATSLTAQIDVNAMHLDGESHYKRLSKQAEQELAEARAKTDTKRKNNKR